MKQRRGRWHERQSYISRTGYGSEQRRWWRERQRYTSRTGYGSEQTRGWWYERQRYTSRTGYGSEQRRGWWRERQRYTISRAGYGSGQRRGWRLRRSRRRVWSFTTRRGYWIKTRLACWVNISSFAGGAALLANVVGGGGLLALGVSWSMARGSSWVALPVSEGRGEPVPGWFIGGRRKKTRAINSCVLYS